jgi:valyl-tRNA synthetase
VVTEFGLAATGRPAGPVSVLEVSAEVLGLIRRAKTTAKRSMRSQVATLTVSDTPERIAALLQAEGDLRDAGGVLSLVTTVADRAAVDVVLADGD